MPELPNKRYLRRGAVRDYFGIDDKEFTELVRAGVLAPLYFRGKGRAFFRRDDVLKAEVDHKVFKPTKEPTK